MGACPEDVTEPGGAPSKAEDQERAAQYARLLGRQLQRVLFLVDLEVAGEPVVADSYAFGPNGGAPPLSPAKPRTRYEALLSYSRNEPRLELIAKTLGRALCYGEFRDGVRPLPIDGFRLRDLARWANYGVASLEANVGSISSYCNCNCEFCYEKGTRGAGIAFGRAQLSRSELETRIRYYSSEKKTGLIPSSRFSLEPFANPHCLEMLERIREAAPGEQISLTTNGSCLTEDVVARLARLRPILVTVSMNAATPELRRRTMRDREPEGATIALDSIPLLRKHEIPFLGSYVPWPSKPLSDMADMVRLLDRHDAVVARICLPSWTDYSHPQAPFDTEAYWRDILEVIKGLREEVSLPIHVMPNMYEFRTLRPLVQGTIKHSPAAQAGFRHGDVIVQIDGQPVYTRPEVSGWLRARFDEPEVSQTTFVVQRAGERITLEVRHPALSELAYPYYWLAHPDAPRTWAGALGLHLADGFEMSSLMRLREIVEDYPGKRLLLFVSPLGEPHFVEAMTLLGDLAQFVDTVDLYVERLYPHYWGGNVVVGDLWTVEDVIAQAREWIARQGERPDVIVLPSTFLSSGGRDLLGRPYLEVERALGVELRLLPCRRIAI
jgi:sulfatase maturation enzyme AslB (radical SAM superfamily)